MKIFSTDQIRQADKITIQNQEITSAQLMERAGYRLFQHLHEGFVPVKGVVWIFCGIGNNGGDGLVIARYLAKARQEVRVVVVNFSENRSQDMEVNYRKLEEMDIPVLELEAGDSLPHPEKNDLVIDAVFGIGLNRRPPAWVEQLFVHLNRSGARIVSVDIPSGLYMDGVPEDPDTVICADHTFTFELPKLVFLLPDSGKYTRNWSLISIDQDREFIRNTPTPYYYTDEKEMAALLRPRTRFTHKGDYGHVLIAGGSYGKIGAALMSAEAALTAGSGLVSAIFPRCGYEVFQTAVPEVMCIPTDDEREIRDLDPGFISHAVAIGPGMGTKKDTAEALRRFLKGYDGPLVLDADALNILAANPEIWALIPENTVLTPHPGEFRRLAGAWKNDREMMEKGIELAGRYRVILVLKGAYTQITDGVDVYFNATGNPGMATGGSGDVLTGIIVSLLGQGYDPLSAARLGVYLHGLSGDIASRQTSQWGLTATDIIDFLGDAFLHLQSAKR